MWAFEWMPPITQWWIQPVSRYQLWRFMCSPSILSLAVSCWSSQTGGCSSISIRLLCGRIDLVPIVDGMQWRAQTSLCHLLDQRYRQTSYALLRLVMLSSGLDVAFVRFVIADRQSHIFLYFWLFCIFWTKLKIIWSVQPKIEEPTQSALSLFLTAHIMWPGWKVMNMWFYRRF